MIIHFYILIKHNIFKLGDLSEKNVKDETNKLRERNNWTFLSSYIVLIDYQDLGSKIKILASPTFNIFVRFIRLT